MLPVETGWWGAWFYGGWVPFKVNLVSSRKFKNISFFTDLSQTLLPLFLSNLTHSHGFRNQTFGWILNLYFCLHLLPLSCRTAPTSSTTISWRWPSKTLNLASQKQNWFSLITPLISNQLLYSFCTVNDKLLPCLSSKLWNLPMSSYIVPTRNHTTVLGIAIISALIQAPRTPYSSRHSSSLILQTPSMYLLCATWWMVTTPMVSNGTFSFPIQYLSWASSSSKYWIIMSY